MLRYFFFFAILIAGCVSYHPLPKDMSRAAHNRINCQEQRGLVIAAEDYSSPEKCQRYFQKDLLSLGYIPVYIAVSNTSQDGEFTLRQENIIFQFENGMEAFPVPVQQVIDEAYYSKVPSAVAMLCGIIPGVVLWLWTDHVNEQLDQDYSHKNFFDCHILPQERKFGFVFFQIPVGLTKNFNPKQIKDGSVEILAFKKGTGTNMAEVFNFLVSIEPK